MTRLADIAHDYHRDGYALIPYTMTFVDVVARQVVELVDEGAAVRVDRQATNRDAAAGTDKGGAYHHHVIEGDVVRTRLPLLWGWYESVRWLAEAVTMRPVILSPYDRSAVNVKVYTEGDEQGWHLDTNAVTALLYLTDVPAKYGTILLPVPRHPEDEPDPVQHAVTAGTLLLMQGRRVLHRVPKLGPDAPLRITAPLNLYHPDDTWRPADIDDVVYAET